MLATPSGISNLRFQAATQLFALALRNSRRANRARDARRNSISSQEQARNNFSIPPTWPRTTLPQYRPYRRLVLSAKYIDTYIKREHGDEWKARRMKSYLVWSTVVNSHIPMPKARRRVVDIFCRDSLFSILYDILKLTFTSGISNSLQNVRNNFIEFFSWDY